MTKGDKAKVFVLAAFLLVLLAEAAFLLLPKNFKLDEERLRALSIVELGEEEQALRRLVAQAGVAPVLQRLLEETKGGTVLECHQTAHYIGRVAYQEFHEEAFELCDASCHSGCYHGAMERLLVEKGGGDVLAILEEQCNSFATSAAVFQCYHGIGHGLLVYLNYDLPVAIEECKKLSNARDFEKTACWSGAFMENIVTGLGWGAGTTPHATMWLKETDPHFPCNALEDDFYIQRECYGMQTSWMLHLADYDFEEVAQECQGAPQDVRFMCFQSLGRDIAGYTLRNPKGIEALCSRVAKGSPYYDDCIYAGVNVIIDFFGPDLTNQASELCRLLQEPSREMCYGSIMSALPTLFARSSEGEAVCKTLPEKYWPLCS